MKFMALESSKISSNSFINGLYVSILMSISHKKSELMHRGRHRAKRARTFDTEAKAKTYAAKHNIKEFKIVRLNSGISKKLMIVSKD